MNFYQSIATAQAQLIWNSKKYHANHKGKRYSEKLTFNQITSAQSGYLNIRNGNEKEYVIKSCKNLSLFQLFKCRLENIYNEALRSYFKVDEISVFWNGLRIYKNKKFTNVQNIEIPIQVLNKNKIEFEIRGAKSAYIKMDLYLNSSSVDSQPPILTTNLESNSTTRVSNLNLQITDESETITRIFNQNNVLIQESDLKNISILLNEGNNFFSIVSVDSQGNESIKVLENITLDSIAPQMSYNFSSNLFYSTFPQNLVFIFTTSEVLQSFTINNTPLLLVAPNTYQFQWTANQAQLLNFDLQLVDLAGNTTHQVLSINVNLDLIPPAPTVNVLSNQITKNSELQFQVQDQDPQTTTNIYVDGVLQHTFTGQQYHLTLEDGVYQIRIVSTDSSGNQSLPVIIEGLTIDTKSPVMTVQLPYRLFIKELPTHLSFDFEFNEKLQSLIVNGVELSVSFDQRTYNYSVQSTANQLQVQYQAIDLAGNVFSGVQDVELIIDELAPEITSSHVPKIIVTSEYLLQFQIVDQSETRTKITLNGIEYPAVTEKNISFLLLFPEDGQQIIEVEVTDEAGWITKKSWTIERNTKPFELSFVSPISFGSYPSMTVQVRLKANKPIQNLQLNGQNLLPNLDQVTAGQDIQLQADGEYTFTSSAVDQFGQSSTARITFVVKSRSLASWEYQECPAN